MQNVMVIGMGLSSRDLTEAQMTDIRSADILMGGRRHLAEFEGLEMEKQVITGKVADTLAFIRKHMAEHRIVVLASGDPLFYGIGARIALALGPDRVTISPNISSVAAAFARVHEPWNDARIISLHGRDRKYHLLGAMRSGGTVAVLTDLNQTPHWLAGWLLDRGVVGWRMAVFQQLGAPEEKFDWYDLEQAAGKTFAQPNVVILKNASEAKSSESELVLGMSDDAFEHERGLITKSEVRALTLAKLRLTPGLTLWDLGAGSGSVGIEAAALLGSGRIIAVEQKPERVAQIRNNARRFGVYHHEVIQAELPEGLATLPRPHRIFIGGGGRRLATIIEHAAGALVEEGIMVVNTVLMDNLTMAVQAMEAEGLTCEVVQIQINKSKTMPWSSRFDAQNPVWIIVGELRTAKE